MKATIHPYKGYLNTEFQLFSQCCEPISFVISSKNDATDMIEGVLNPNEPFRIKMPQPGSYDVHFGNDSTAEITVEDGYRFGGGQHKKNFIFDTCPWVFVVMHDRTYFHNRETNEEYVEVISPDTIIEVSKDYVLFKNDGQKEGTLYSLVEQKPIICASDILYHNPHFILWSVSYDDDQPKELVVYSINKRIVVFRNRYSQISIDKHDNRIYCVNNDKVQSICISNDENYVVDSLNIKGIFVAFAYSTYAVFIEDSYNRKELVIYNLKTCAEKGRIIVSGYMSRVNDAKLIDVSQRYKSIQNFNIKESDFPEAIISAEYIEYDIFPCEEDVFYKETLITLSSKSRNYQEEYVLKSTSTELSEDIKGCHKVVLTDDFFCIYGSQESVVIPLRYRHRLTHKQSGIIHSYKDKMVIEEDNSYSHLNQYGFWQASIEKKCNFYNYSDYGIILDKETNEIVNNKTLGSFIVRDHQKNYIKTENAIIRPDGTTLWTQNVEHLPSDMSPKFKYGLELINNEINLYESKGTNSGFSQPKRVLSELYDASKYMNVFFSEDGHQILYRDNNVFTMFDIDKTNITEFENLHYISHINGSKPLFRLDESRQAILINPITGRPVDFDLISNYQFLSPNGELYADSELDKYIEHYNRITSEVIDAQEHRELIKLLDFPAYIWTTKEDYNKKKKDAIIARKNFISSHQEYFDELPDEKKEKLLIEPSFVCNFIEIRGVAIIRKVSSKEEYCRIPLGLPLRYINYAAFSYDNRYVAIAGCYPLGTGGGLYLVYDLVNQSVICKSMTEKAVWSTSFSKNGAIAAYTSSPISFFASSEQNYFKSVQNENIITGFNFLSFSPDGKYFACSGQKYISYRKGNGETRTIWGHQHSSLVSIRATNNPQGEIIQFNDLSDFGRGVADSFMAQSVASVSFSNDNNRIMMVGNDGVVIIRNLYLNSYASE